MLDRWQSVLSLASFAWDWTSVYTVLHVMIDRFTARSSAYRQARAHLVHLIASSQPLFLSMLQQLAHEIAHIQSFRTFVALVIAIMV